MLPIEGHEAASKNAVDAPAAAGAAPVTATATTTYRAQAGDLVEVRESRWRVTHVRACAAPRAAQATAGTDGVRPAVEALAQQAVRNVAAATDATPAAMSARVVSLRGADDRNRWQHCTLLEPFDRVAPCPMRESPRAVSRRRWMRAFAALVAATGAVPAPETARMPITLPALAGARVALLAYQLEPLLAILHGVASRLLIADAVGLGKTIQAALVLRELSARSRAGRVLILVPAGLRDQWQRELRMRVGLDSRIVDAAALSARVRELPADINPWHQPGIVIVSLDFIKQDVVLHGLGLIAWDVLVIDEAHALTTGTDRAAAAHLLAQHSRLVLLLTATPHAGSDQEFDALCRIGRLDHDQQNRHDRHDRHDQRDQRDRHDGLDRHNRQERHDRPERQERDDGDDPIAIFRRTRRSLGIPTGRRVRVLRVRQTPAERHLHDLLTRYVTRVEHERGSQPGEPVTLAMTTLRKRASSSAWSLARTLERRLALLLTAASEPRADEQPTQPALPFDAEGVDAEADADANASASAAVGDAQAEGGEPLRALDEAEEGSGAHAQAEEEAVAGADADVRIDACGPGEIDAADDEPLAWLSAPGLSNLRVERAWLSVLIQAARDASRHDSKRHALQRLLRRVREPALVYTEYRDTLTHIADSLTRADAEAAEAPHHQHLQAVRRDSAAGAAGVGITPRVSPPRVATLHGALTREAREESLRRFTTGDATVLLATDAAGEGLNLQHRCRLVINIELPWNPNRLEQRIGRVDRLGQSKTVHAIHLVSADSSEEILLDTLHTRVGSIASALGERPAVLDMDKVVDVQDPDGSAASPVEQARHTVAVMGAREGGEATGRVWPQLSVEARDAVRAMEQIRALRAGPGLTDRGDPSSRAERAERVEPAEPAEGAQQMEWAERTERAQAAMRAVHGDQANQVDDVDRAERAPEHDVSLALDRRAPWIARVRRRTRGPFVDLTNGSVCVWRTRVRFDDGGCVVMRELMTALHVPRTSGGSHDRARRDPRPGPGPRPGPEPEPGSGSIAADLNDLMRGVVDRLARTALDASVVDEQAWRARAAARDLAIVRVLRTPRMLSTRAGGGGRGGGDGGGGGRSGKAAASGGGGALLWAGADAPQPLLFRDFAADREARQIAPGRPHFQAADTPDGNQRAASDRSRHQQGDVGRSHPETDDTTMTAAAAAAASEGAAEAAGETTSPASSAVFEHALVLVLDIR
jgi:ERCC4-related helicase